MRKLDPKVPLHARDDGGVGRWSPTTFSLQAHRLGLSHMVGHGHMIITSGAAGLVVCGCVFAGSAGLWGDFGVALCVCVGGGRTTRFWGFRHCCTFVVHVCGKVKVAHRNTPTCAHQCCSLLILSLTPRRVYCCCCTVLCTYLPAGKTGSIKLWPETTIRCLASEASK